MEDYIKIYKIKEILKAKQYTDKNLDDKIINGAYASDLMSDVLTTNFYEENSILISGLNNPQVIRTAELLDIDAILLVRGKKPTDETIAMAKENDIVLIGTDFNMYNSCGILYSNGVKGITNEKNKKLCVQNSKK